MKRTIHFSIQEIEEILQKEGVSFEDSIEIGGIIYLMPKKMLDSLYKALNIIRKLKE